MADFNPPTEPAADRHKPRRRNPRNRSKLKVLPDWAPGFHPHLSRVTEESVSPKTIPKQYPPAMSENMMTELREGGQPLQYMLTPALLKRKVSLLTGHEKPLSSYQRSTDDAPCGFLPKSQAQTDHSYCKGRTIIVTAYQRINDKWSDDPKSVIHEAIHYSAVDQTADYLDLMLGSIPEETFESHRGTYIIPRNDWGSPDVFGLKWHRLYLRENTTKGALSFMCEDKDMADFLEAERGWTAKLFAGDGDYSPPYMRLEMELTLFDWRRAMIMGVRNDIFRDAGIMPRNR